MTSALLTDRPNITEPVVGALRDLIVDGALPDGARINEVRFAKRLGVSRTPLREALMRLASEGWVAIVPRKGFFVQPMTLEEFDQIYPIRALLDPEALRLGGLPAPDRLTALRLLAGDIEKSRKPAALVRLDEDWHRLLISRCPNRVLLRLIEQFMARTRRYELALCREGSAPSAMAEGHAAILDALENGDLVGGCAALHANMQSGIGPIRAWLSAREAPALSERRGPL